MGVEGEEKAIRWSTSAGMQGKYEAKGETEGPRRRVRKMRLVNGLLGKG